MKKLVSFLLALVMAMSMFAVATAESSDKTVIQFWHSMGGKNGEAIVKMVETFNASQDKIEVVATFQGDYYTSIANAITAIASGNSPDIIQSGSDQVRLLSDEEGVVANMFDFMSKEEGVWYEDFNPGFIESYVTNEGKYLSCLPMGCSTPVLYCNKTLLDKAGCAIPTTWEEMEAVCEKLIGDGLCKYGFVQPRDSWYFWMMIPNYAGKEIFSADGMKLDCREGGIEAFQFLEDMIKKNYFCPAPATDGGTICTQMMQTQECAFYINSIGGLGTMESAAEAGGYEMVVSGVPGKVVNSVPSGGNSLVILESGKKDAAWEFMKWLYTSEDGIAYFDSVAGYFAVTDTIKNTAILQEKIAGNANYANAYNFLGNVNNNHRIKGESDIATEVMNFMDACFYDLEDVAQQWDILEEGVNEKLAEANE
ncbi:MAG: extracellular solute-binding protein [Clostridia bacterium]